MSKNLGALCVSLKVFRTQPLKCEHEIEMETEIDLYCESSLNISSFADSPMFCESF